MQTSNALQKDETRVFTEVVQKRLLLPENTTILLVEGPDDIRVYSRFTDTSRCKIVVCDGKSNLIGAVERLQQRIDIEGYVGIVDSDFDELVDKVLPENVLSTDGHDLEVMILDSDALDDLLEELLHGNEKHDVINCKRKVKERLWTVSAIIGYLHLILVKSEHRGARLDFLTGEYLKQLKPDCELSLSDVSRVLTKSVSWITESQISETQLKVLTGSNRKKHLCRGHDMLEILRITYSRLGSLILGKEIYAPMNLSKRLFDAYKYDYFKSTLLFEKILEWEYENRAGCFVVLID